MKKKEDDKELGNDKTEAKKSDSPIAAAPASTVSAPVESTPLPQKAIAAIDSKKIDEQQTPLIFCDYGLGKKVCSRCGSKKITSNGKPKCAISLGPKECPFL